MSSLYHVENAREGLLRTRAEFPDQLYRELPAGLHELPLAVYSERCHARKDSLELQMDECSRQTLVIKQQGKENSYISETPPSPPARDSTITTRSARRLDTRYYAGGMTLRDLLSVDLCGENG